MQTLIKSNNWPDIQLDIINATNIIMCIRNVRGQRYIVPLLYTKTISKTTKHRI